MICVAAATHFEMRAFHDKAPQLSGIDTLLTGVGPTASGITMARWLGRQEQLPLCVVNFGIAGAYYQKNHEKGAQMLDICLAEQEILGDFGICHDTHIEYFTNPKFETDIVISLDSGLKKIANSVFTAAEIPIRQGNFVTVNCTSATKKRGDYLAASHGGLCENMEGAAVALACRSYRVPCLEIRVISNMVGDRDQEAWRLEESCQKAGWAVALLVKPLMEMFSR